MCHNIFLPSVFHKYIHMYVHIYFYIYIYTYFFLLCSFCCRLSADGILYLHHPLLVVLLLFLLLLLLFLWLSYLLAFWVIVVFCCSCCGLFTLLDQLHHPKPPSPLECVAYKANFYEESEKAATYSEIPCCPSSLLVGNLIRARRRNGEFCGQVIKLHGRF